MGGSVSCAFPRRLNIAGFTQFPALHPISSHIKLMQYDGSESPAPASSLHCPARRFRTLRIAGQN